MEMRAQPILFKSHGRTGTFDGTATCRNKKYLDPRPLDRAGGWFGKYCFQRLSVLAVHG